MATDAKKQMVVRTYGIEIDVYEQARQVAEQNGTTVAAVVRAAVEAFAATASPKSRARTKASVISKEPAKKPAARKPAAEKAVAEKAAE